MILAQSSMLRSRHKNQPNLEIMPLLSRNSPKKTKKRITGKNPGKL